MVSRPELSYDKIIDIDKNREVLPIDIIEQIDINIKYAGYIERQIKQVESFKNMEKKLILT